MRVLLNVKIREEDNNRSTTELHSLYKYEDLIIDPARHTFIVLGDGTTFYVNLLIQDLQKDIVVLVYYKDIFYRYNREGEHLELKESYIEKGWSPHDISV